MNPAKTLTEKEIAMLAELPEIDSIGDDGRIMWAPWFRDEVVRRIDHGEHPTEIFRSHGIGPEAIGAKRIERCAQRWRRRRRDRERHRPPTGGAVDVLIAQSQRIDMLERRVRTLTAELNALHARMARTDGKGDPR
ncbi:hypothetical protein [Bifidobacterium simiarum]|uniref:hypothetical protein n=1 Tax=Bifidobacterium simiarum TaxID=2045441 RepID=UPI001BDD9BE1|nr:hypothetical protein [Bifidobacterium simiarum]MBT1167247.1 hypothetical protein [Bifidobacterium simiarum]